MTWFKGRQICESLGAHIEPIDIGWTDVISWQWADAGNDHKILNQSPHFLLA